MMIKSEGVVSRAMLYLIWNEWLLLTSMSIVRERLTQEASRAAALEAARLLLVEEGPQAVTLKAVGARIGKTHANLLHHFGSAAGLQAELARYISSRVTAKIGKAVIRTRAGEADPREIVDGTFDAFGEEGGGALAAWMILSGNRDALDPILESIHALVDQLGEGHEGRPVQDITLWLVLAALGDSLLGAPMANALGLSRDKARDLACMHLVTAAGVADQAPRP
jgi:AcrR family transcriptional regulator